LSVLVRDRLLEGDSSLSATLLGRAEDGARLAGPGLQRARSTGPADAASRLHHRGSAGPAIVLLASAFALGGPPFTAAQEADRSGYPAVWWEPVSPEQAYDWEILPQSAGPGEVILSKRNELGALSNFAATPFRFRGRHYNSVEGFWQMMKYPEDPDDPRAQYPGLVWQHTRAEVSQMVAFEAKAAGDLGTANMKRMGINWVTFEGQRLPYRVPEKGAHYRLIVAAMRAKLAQNPKVEALLLRTDHLVLKPDHKQEENPPPAWRYFDIWMELRAELQQAGQRPPR
jgi:hypothetical protein